MRLKLALLLFCLALIVLYESCSSGKASFEQGNYYESVITSVNRLRRSPDNKKAAETLQQAYPLAVKYYEDQASAALATNNQFKWSTVVQSYTTINSMYDEIRRSPGALKVIPNPVNYHAKLDEAKKNAAEENYSAGILALSAGTRDRAKQAYQYFKTASEFVPNYKDVNQMMEEALWAATVKVLVEPIPTVSQNVAISAEFFNDKVSEYLHAQSLSQFVRFFTLREAQNLNLKPDHVIKLSFDDFAIGQVYKKEREVLLQRDSVVVATYITPTTPAVTTTTGPATVNPATPADSQNQNQTQTQTPPSTPNPTQPGTGGSTQTGDNTKTDNNTNSTNPGNTNTGGDNKEKDQGKDQNQDKDKSKDSESPEDNDKVTICHIPPGNTGNPHTLVISRAALQAHLAHGDQLGFCDEKENKNKGQGDDKGNPGDKGGQQKGSDKKGSGGAFIRYNPATLVASAGSHVYLDEPADTTKVYATVKATLFHFQKTVTSNGVLSFKIMDGKTNAILSAEKMPGQYVWVSEWAYFNGDERALTQDQLAITRQKEQTPPSPQDMFYGFTQPMFDQLISRINEFYKNY